MTTHIIKYLFFSYVVIDKLLILYIRRGWTYIYINLIKFNKVAYYQGIKGW